VLKQKRGWLDGYANSEKQLRVYRLYIDSQVPTVGVLSRWKWASLILSPWFPWGFESPNSRSFRKSLQASLLSAVLPKKITPKDNGASALFLVPKGKGNVQQAVRVRHTGNAVFTPSVRPRPGVVMREVWKFNQ